MCFFFQKISSFFQVAIAAALRLATFLWLWFIEMIFPRHVVFFIEPSAKLVFSAVLKLIAAHSVLLKARPLHHVCFSIAVRMSVMVSASLVITTVSSFCVVEYVYFPLCVIFFLVYVVEH